MRARRHERDANASRTSRRVARRGVAAPRARVSRALRNETSRRPSTAALIVSVLALACCVIEGWGGDGLLFVLPALLLGLVLLARRYPGERLLVAARAAQRTRWPRAQSQPRMRARPAAAAIARGGQLLARSLAVRPPPRAALLPS